MASSRRKVRVDYFRFKKLKAAIKIAWSNENKIKLDLLKLGRRVARQKLGKGRVKKIKKAERKWMRE